MAIRRSSKKVSIPTKNPILQSDFVDSDNDYIVVSRRGNLVDRSGYQPRSIKNKREAGRVFNSNKDDYGNSGIARLPVITDSDKW